MVSGPTRLGGQEAAPMDRNGFSLLELVVVICIIGVLVAVATLKFNEAARRSGIESQTKMLYADLMKLRAHALFKKQKHTVKFTRTNFSIYSSGHATGAPIVQRELRYAMRAANVTLHVDERGLVEFGNSICVDDDGSGAGFDSLVVSATRIQMGKRVAGGSCNSDDIRTM